MTVPSVGRVVHYVPGQDVPCVAAIVTAVQDETLLTLTTFPKAGPNVVADVPEDDFQHASSDTWHWPERV